MTIINQKYTTFSGLKDTFFASKPFPHIVLDDFLDKDFFNQIQSSFGEVDRNANGRSFNSVVEEKKWISLNAALPDAIKSIVDTLHTSEWVKNLVDLTGMQTLIATPHGNTKLANYHVMAPGGVLGPHVDHSSEPKSGLPHVLNIILYLSADWREKDGGATEFYDKKGSKILARVPYRSNRAVIFLHTPFSFHGVERIAPDASFSRRSIYVDYYSTDKQPYKGLPLSFPKIWFEHSTTFKLDSSLAYLQRRNKAYAKNLAKYYLSMTKAMLKV